MSEQQTVIELSKKVEELSNMIAKLVPIASPQVEPIVEKEDSIEDSESNLVIKLKDGREILQTFHPNGAIASKIYINPKTGLETISDGFHPSSSYYDENCRIIRVEWKKEGKYYRRDNGQPNVVMYHTNGIRSRVKYYNEQGVYDRTINCPTCIEYDNNGNITYEEFMLNGIYSHENEWDHIYYKNGKVYKRSKDMSGVHFRKKDITKSEKYNSEGKLIQLKRFPKHSDMLPTRETFDPTGEFKLEDLWEGRSPLVRENVKHRLGGPAQVLYHCGKPFLSNYFRNGVLIKSDYHDLSV